LTEAKAEVGQIPDGVATSVIRKIDDALEFIDVVHDAATIKEPMTRARELAMLGPEIRRRNDEIFFSGVANQAFPINRDIGGRWFDELGWDVRVVDAVASGGGSPTDTTSTAGARRTVPFHPALPVGREA
jgi:hypothetical protein